MYTDSLLRFLKLLSYERADESAVTPSSKKIWKTLLGILEDFGDPEIHVMDGVIPECDAVSRSTQSEDRVGNELPVYYVPAPVGHNATTSNCVTHMAANPPWVTGRWLGSTHPSMSVI